MRQTGVLLFRTLIQDVFPAVCCICDAPVETDLSIHYGICRSCSEGLVPLQSPLCIFCGIPLGSEDQVCMSCRDYESALPGVQRLRSVFLYAGTGPDILHAYKTHGAKSVARFFAEKLLPLLTEVWVSGAILVPVPSLGKNRKSRGFDQVQLLLRNLPENFRSFVRPRFLRRDNSVSQKILNRKERQTNLEGKIRMSGKMPISSPVILVDDICTTGATLSACAAVLRSAGARQVFALTIFRD